MSLGLVRSLTVAAVLAAPLTAAGSSFIHEVQLLAGDAAAADSFGVSVSVSGDTAVVGAAADDTAAGLNAGSAYVSGRFGTVWTEHRKLLAPDGAALDNLGASVSVAGDTVLVGGPFDDTSGGGDAGSAHVFRGVVPVELETFTVE